MAASTSLFAHIQRLIAPSAVDGGSDAELLQRFVCNRDQAAFAVLAARHGPMVLRLCRRVLGDAHAAEDACQAAFLVLARKADRIHHPETLSSWLHGVAYRLALKARAADVRRRQIETQHLRFAPSPSPSDPLGEVSARELLSIVDAELQRLPERYRLPLILCCLEGRSQPEAARLLGWTPGSVKGRLERGRAKLHQRLVRRGLTLPAVLLALEATRDAASAHLPVLLRTAILRAVSTAETVEGISTAVRALAEGSLGDMATAKVKLVSALVLMLGLAVGGFGALVYPQLAAHPQKEQQKAEPIPTAKETRQPKEKRQLRRDRYGDPLPPGALARLGTIRLRPGEHVHRLACLPDHKTFLSVATAEEKMLVSTWRRTTGELLRRFEAPMRSLREAALTPDGKTLVTFGNNRMDRTFRVLAWDVSSGKKKGELTGSGGEVLALAFSPDGKTLATAGEDQTLRLWDVAAQTELRRLAGAKEKWWHMAFSSDGKILAAIGKGHTVQLWDADTGKARKTVNLGPGAEQAVAFSPDCKSLVTTGRDGKNIRLWDLTAGKMVRAIATEIATVALAFSPDGKMLATGDTRQEKVPLRPSAIRLWDASTGRELRRLDGHLFGVSALAFSPDGKQLLSGGVGGVLHLWDTATGKDPLSLDEHESYVNSITFSPNGRFLATAGMDGTSRLWEPASVRPARLFERKHQQRVWDVAFVPNGRSLISYGHDGSIRFWDVVEGRQTQQWTACSDRSTGSLAFSPDCQMVAIREQNAPIRVLDAATGKEQKRLTAANSNFSSLLFSPDSKKLAAMSGSVGGGSGALQLWDTPTGKELRKWAVAQAGPIVFSPDGRTIFSVAGGFALPRMGQRTFQSWDVATGENHPFQTAQNARVSSMAVSLDGRMLVWGDAEGTVTLCELASGEVRRRLKGHYSYVQSLAFSPDGKSLASASADTTVLIWDVTGRPTEERVGSFPAEQLQAFWSDLAGKDAGKAFDAIGLLTASPEQAVPLLKRKLHPAPEPAERQQVARLIAELDSDQFAMREKAKEQLHQLGERAEPGLRETLQSKPPLEARKRIEELLEGLKALSVSPERLRELRAVEVLEHIGTAEARQILRKLADGAAHARLTRDARASLERLDKRPAPKH